MMTILILAAAALLETLMETTMEVAEALMETIRAFVFGKTHNYRGCWKP